MVKIHGLSEAEMRRVNELTDGGSQLQAGEEDKKLLWKVQVTRHFEAFLRGLEQAVPEEWYACDPATIRTRRELLTPFLGCDSADMLEVCAAILQFVRPLVPAVGDCESDSDHVSRVRFDNCQLLLEHVPIAHSAPTLDSLVDLFSLVARVNCLIDRAPHEIRCSLRVRLASTAIGKLMASQGFRRTAAGATDSFTLPSPPPTSATASSSLPDATATPALHATLHQQTPPTAASSQRSATLAAAASRSLSVHCVSERCNFLQAVAVHLGKQNPTATTARDFLLSPFAATSQNGVAVPAGFVGADIIAVLSVSNDLVRDLRESESEFAVLTASRAMALAHRGSVVELQPLRTALLFNRSKFELHEEPGFLLSSRKGRFCVCRLRLRESGGQSLSVVIADWPCDSVAQTGITQLAQLLERGALPRDNILLVGKFHVETAVLAARLSLSLVGAADGEKVASLNVMSNSVQQQHWRRVVLICPGDGFMLAAQSQREKPAESSPQVIDARVCACASTTKCVTDRCPCHVATRACTPACSCTSKCERKADVRRADGDDNYNS